MSRILPALRHHLYARNTRPFRPHPVGSTAFMVCDHPKHGGAVNVTALAVEHFDVHSQIVTARELPSGHTRHYMPKYVLSPENAMNYLLKIRAGGRDVTIPVRLRQACADVHSDADDTSLEVSE